MTYSIKCKKNENRQEVSSRSLVAFHRVYCTVVFGNRLQNPSNEIPTVYERLVATIQFTAAQ